MWCCCHATTDRNSPLPVPPSLPGFLEYPHPAGSDPPFLVTFGSSSEGSPVIPCFPAVGRAGWCCHRRRQRLPTSEFTLGSRAQGQPRQHEADQRDGVFRFIETHLKDQPRPQPTDQRFRWLARLASLCFKNLSLVTSRASIYSLLLLDNGFYSINQ